MEKTEVNNLGKHDKVRDSPIDHYIKEVHHEKR